MTTFNDSYVQIQKNNNNKNDIDIGHDLISRPQHICTSIQYALNACGHKQSERLRLIDSNRREECILLYTMTTTTTY